MPHRGGLIHNLLYAGLDHHSDSQQREAERRDMQSSVQDRIRRENAANQRQHQQLQQSNLQVPHNGPGGRSHSSQREVTSSTSSDDESGIENIDSEPTPRGRPLEKYLEATPTAPETEPYLPSYDEAVRARPRALSATPAIDTSRLDPQPSHPQQQQQQSTSSNDFLAPQGPTPSLSRPRSAQNLQTPRFNALNEPSNYGSRGRHIEPESPVCYLRDDSFLTDPGASGSQIYGRREPSPGLSGMGGGSGGYNRMGMGRIEVGYDRGYSYDRMGGVTGMGMNMIGGGKYGGGGYDRVDRYDRSYDRGYRDATYDDRMGGRMGRKGMRMGGRRGIGDGGPISTLVGAAVSAASGKR